MLNARLVWIFLVLTSLSACKTSAYRDGSEVFATDIKNVKMDGCDTGAVAMSEDKLKEGCKDCGVKHARALRLALELPRTLGEWAAPVTIMASDAVGKVTDPAAKIVDAYQKSVPGGGIEAVDEWLLGKAKDGKIELTLDKGEKVSLDLNQIADRMAQSFRNELTLEKTSVAALESFAKLASFAISSTVVNGVIRGGETSTSKDGETSTSKDGVQAERALQNELLFYDDVFAKTANSVLTKFPNNSVVKVGSTLIKRAVAINQVFRTVPFDIDDLRSEVGRLNSSFNSLISSSDGKIFTTDVIKVMYGTLVADAAAGALAAGAVNQQVKYLETVIDEKIGETEGGKYIDLATARAEGLARENGDNQTADRIAQNKVNFTNRLVISEAARDQALTEARVTGDQNFVDHDARMQQLSRTNPANFSRLNESNQSWRAMVQNKINADRSR